VCSFYPNVENWVPRPTPSFPAHLLVLPPHQVQNRKEQMLSAVDAVRVDGKLHLVITATIESACWQWLIAPFRRECKHTKVHVPTAVQ
jgi:hypothetical protein